MSEFGIDINNFIERANGNVQLSVAAIRLDVSKRTILNTPVGNPLLWKSPPPPNYEPGSARANWQAQSNSPITTNVSIKDTTGAVTIRRVLGVANEPAENIYYLSNNLPYIRRLEYGWSTQAPSPPGIVRLAVMDTMNSISAIVRAAIES